MRYLLPLLLLLSGCVPGFVACYVWIGWQAQVATAYAQLYAVGAMEMADKAEACQRSLPALPRRR